MIRKWLSFRTLSIALALVLLVTAALKLHLLLTDPFADIKTGTSLPLLWLAVFGEAGVVWIVFSKTADQLKWLALISLFGIMAVVSVCNVLVGKTSCGCAGKIEISPELLLKIDTLVVMVLFLVRPIFEKTATFLKVTPKVFGRILAFGIIASVMVSVHTNIVKTFLRTTLLGHDVEAIAVQLGQQKMGAPINCELRLRNHSQSPRKIVGVGKSCACIVPQNVVHTTIPKAGDQLISVTIVPKNTGYFHQRILFYLDSSRQYVVAADLFAHFEEN